MNLAQINEAFLAAYVDFRSVKMMVRLRLNNPLDFIPAGADKQSGVFQLIEHAEAEGWLPELLQALYADKPNNPKVRDLAAGKGPMAAPVAPAAPVWSPSDSGFEALTNKDNKIELVSSWEAALHQAKARVCRIESPAGTAIGTGFLVGFDIILTNHHVAKVLMNGQAVARFDYFAEGAEGKVVEIKLPPVASSTEDRLDFALLQLAEKVEKARGKFTPKAHKFGENQVYLILQHAKGGPLQIGIGRLKSYDALHEGLLYDVNTDRGSSGSPIFTVNWELVGLHHFGHEESNRGISLEPIWQMLQEGG